MRREATTTWTPGDLDLADRHALNRLIDAVARDAGGNDRDEPGR